MFGDAFVVQAVINEAVLQGPTDTFEIYAARLDRQLGECMKTGRQLTNVEVSYSVKIMQVFPDLSISWS